MAVAHVGILLQWHQLSEHVVVVTCNRIGPWRALVENQLLIDIQHLARSTPYIQGLETLARNIGTGIPT